MKPRRDITLGEMQDECLKRERTCNTEPRCPVDELSEILANIGRATGISLRKDGAIE